MKLNWLFSLAMLSGCLTAAELKVRNLDFSEGEKHWRNAYPDVVQTGLEDGKLKMTVLKEKGSHGAFVQYFAEAPSITRSAIRLFFHQVNTAGKTSSRNG